MITIEPNVLDINAVARRCGVHPKTIAKWERTGRMPRAERPTLRTRRWPAKVIDEWLAATRSDDALRARQDGG